MSATADDVTQSRFQKKLERLTKRISGPDCPEMVDGGHHVLEWSKLTLPLTKADQSYITSFFEALATNKKVQKLDLSGCTIGDEMAKVLADVLRRNNTLKGLYLSKTKIGLIGFEALVNVLRENETIHDLLLVDIEMMNDAAVSSLAKALFVNRTLSYIRLSFLTGNISKEAYWVLVSAREKNTTITSFTFDVSTSASKHQATLDAPKETRELLQEFVIYNVWLANQPHIIIGRKNPTEILEYLLEKFTRLAGLTKEAQLRLGESAFIQIRDILIAGISDQLKKVSKDKSVTKLQFKQMEKETNHKMGQLGAIIDAKQKVFFDQFDNALTKLGIVPDNLTLWEESKKCQAKELRRQASALASNPALQLLREAIALEEEQQKKALLMAHFLNFDGLKQQMLRRFDAQSTQIITFEREIFEKSNLGSSDESNDAAWSALLKNVQARIQARQARIHKILGIEELLSSFCDAELPIEQENNGFFERHHQESKQAIEAEQDQKQADERRLSVANNDVPSSRSSASFSTTAVQSTVSAEANTEMNQSLQAIESLLAKMEKLAGLSEEQILALGEKAFKQIFATIFSTLNVYVSNEALKLVNDQKKKELELGFKKAADAVERQLKLFAMQFTEAMREFDIRPEKFKKEDVKTQQEKEIEAEKLRSQANILAVDPDIVALQNELQAAKEKTKRLPEEVLAEGQKNETLLRLVQKDITAQCAELFILEHQIKTQTLQAGAVAGVLRNSPAPVLLSATATAIGKPVSSVDADDLFSPSGEIEADDPAHLRQWSSVDC